MELKRVSNENTFLDFTQKLDNGMNVFDFEKISKLNSFITIIISSRGMAGKTYNAKDYIYKDWKRTKRPSMWLRNLNKHIDNEASKFIYGNVPEPYNNCSIKGSIDKNNCWVYDEENKPFIKLQALNNASEEKGTRILYKNWIFDEFNVGSNLVKNILIKFDDLLHSTEDIVNNYGKKDDTQIYIFGNNLTLSHPLLFNLGITSIYSECDKYYLGDKLLVSIIYKKFEQDEKEKIEKDNENNKRFLLTKLLGLSEHSYFNETLYDKTNMIYHNFNIVNLKYKINLEISPEWCFFTGNNWILIFRYKKEFELKNQYNSKILFHCVSLSHIKKEYEKVNIKIKDENWLLPYKYSNDTIDDGINYISHQFKKILLECIENEIITYEDIFSRNLFINMIK